MTRRIGHAISKGGAAFLIAAEAAGTLVLVRVFSDRTPAGAVRTLVIGLAVATLVLIGAQAIAVLARAARSRHEDQDDAARGIWSDRWIDVVFGEAEAPAGPLPRTAVESLLDLRESLTGEPAEMVSSMMRDYGVETGLIERLQETARAASTSPKTVIKPRRAIERRIEALDDLGRARTPKAVPTLLGAAADDEPTTRQAGIRALARSVAAITDEAERRAVAAEVLNVLRDAQLSMGGLGEAMELLGPAAPYVIAPILERPHRYGNRMLIAALDTVSRMRLDDLGTEVARFATSRRSGVRLAALHALTKLERLPVTAAPSIQEAFRDRDSNIRIEGARAAKHLEIKTAIYYLEELLCDDDWTVRRVAATSLAGLGGPGIRTLIATSLVHGDERARSIATQVLVESRSAAELDLEPEKVG